MIALVVATFFAGWGLSSLRPIKPALVNFAEKYVISVALPAVIVSKMSRVDVDASLLIPIVSAWVIMGICVVVYLVVAHFLHWDRTVVGAVLCVGVLGNTSFLGLGMVEGLLGTDHLPAAIAYDQLGTFLALSLWGAYVTGTYGTASVHGRDVLKRLFRFAPFVALLVSVPVRYLSVRSEVFGVLDGIGKTVAPVAMATVGMRFRLRISRGAVLPAVWAIAIKMFAVPFVVICAVLLWGRRGDLMWSTTAVQAAAPPMVTAGIVAVRAGLDEEVVAFVVGVGTIIGFLSVPAASLLVR